ncbi:cytochrome P450 [Longimycelium tulufanense]|uniref:Cytochrome P450 n=1 Tax=Longimycelium tulufanense TaxID=907463 RepID=A0A8J3FUV1_9PSEU|nr:cytochrome P450 [Longimycelium tulufanense]GGM46489.1 cytochrome P450 [Longimycelium tulufanense]
MSWNEFRLRFTTFSFLDSLTDSASGVFEVRARDPRRLLVWHPDAIEAIFRVDRRMGHLPSGTLGPLLGRQSLLWLDGPRHSLYRKALGPALSGRQLDGWRDIISGTVHSAVDALHPGAVVPLASWARSLTLRVISHLVFGRVEGELLTALRAWVEGVLGSRSRTLAYHYLRVHPSLLALRGTFHRLRPNLDRMLLASGRAAESRSLSALLLAEGPLAPLEDAELRDQLLSLLFAGHETTASATAWTLYLLSQHEEVQHDVLDEVSGTSADGWDAGELPLLHAVVQEAMRVCPPALVAGKRVPLKETELDGEVVRPGTVLTPCIYLAHHRPDEFASSERFDPRRFLDQRLPARHYLPFGGGTRRCLGSDLALREIRLVVAAVLRRRQLRCVNPGAGVRQLRGPTMAPSSRLRMEVTACRD